MPDDTPTLVVAMPGTTSSDGCRRMKDGLQERLGIEVVIIRGASALAVIPAGNKSISFPIEDLDDEGPPPLDDHEYTTPDTRSR